MLFPDTGAAMDILERAYHLDRILKSRRTPVSMRELCERLECSKSTVKRSLANLRHLGAPIFNTEGKGYSYDKRIAFELPGVWFSPEELHALLSIEQLTGKLSGGLFDTDIRRLRSKATELLGRHMPDSEQLARIRVLGAGSRSHALPVFSTVADSVLRRKCLQLVYHGRARNSRTQRKVSPQRLVFYRGNWYLDAWCHAARGLRSFAVERIEQARMLDEACKRISDAELDRKLARTFGIFSGEPTAVAVLRFSEKAARWVRDEEWFPDQEVRELDDGGAELRIPYGNPTELVMEICRQGSDVKVIEPAELREMVAAALRAAVEQYR